MDLFVTGRMPSQNSRLVLEPANFMQCNATGYSDAVGWRLAGILKFNDCRYSILRALVYRRLAMEVCPNLRLTYVASNINGVTSGLVGLSGKSKGPDQQHGAEKDQASGNPGSPHHALRGFIHSLRGSVHSLLGSKVIGLVFLSYGFAALAGLGGYIVFDDLNRERKRQWFGRALLCCCPSLRLSVSFWACPDVAMATNPNATAMIQERKGIGERILL
jgi:hypothetical protein